MHVRNFMMIRRLTLALGLSVLSAFVLSSLTPLAAGQRDRRLDTATTSSNSGATATLLPDGHWLLVGGAGSERDAAVWDAETSAYTPTKGRLEAPRSFHTATVLPDGTVLILGGRNGDALVETREIFDPATGTFMAIPVVGSVSRVSHTATLLTDGRVLVAGGSNGVWGGAPTEIWDLNAHTATPVGGIDRSGHTATLMPDGRVLLAGGRTTGGQTAVAALIVNTERGTIVNAQIPEQTRTAPMVTASIPARGATNVELDAHITVRFSAELNRATVTDETMRLTGPSGPVAARVIAAEGGRLVFIWPADSFGDTSSYALLISGVTDRFGTPVAPVTIRFTTRARHAEASDTVQTEEWVRASRSAGVDGAPIGRPRPGNRCPRSRHRRASRRYRAACSGSTGGRWPM
jgi:Bacterial Ig-like domain/Galactose oxidase, central domain